MDPTTLLHGGLKITDQLFLQPIKFGHWHHPVHIIQNKGRKGKDLQRGGRGAVKGYPTPQYFKGSQ